MNCAIWIALISAATAGAQCVEISGDRIRARDLAGALSAFAALPPETEIAISPVPGVTRKLPAAQLSKALGAPVAADICVKRVTRSLTVDEITAALRKSLQDDEAKVSILDYSRASIPEGQLDFPRSGLSLSSNTPSIWRGRIQYGAGRSTAMWAKVRISKPTKILVARRVLPVGHVLSAADVEERQIDSYSLAPPALVDPGKLEGLEAAREIRAETTIQPWMLRAKAAIKKGDLLQVSVNASSAPRSRSACWRTRSPPRTPRSS